MRVATNRFAAISIIRQQLCFIPYADLAHLDPRLVSLGQRLDQFAEIDPVLGQVIKDDAFAAEEVFDIDQLHLEPFFLDQVVAPDELNPFTPPHVVEMAVQDCINQVSPARDAVALSGSLETLQTMEAHEFVGEVKYATEQK